MTVIFVHGVPDTARLWDPLIATLGQGDYRALSLPGFGAASPAGFDSHMDSYAAWVITQIESAPGPVHLVGHDWGGLLSLRVAHLCPDLIASWAVLNASLYPDLKWHRLARLWQTRWKGELAMMLMRGARGRKLLRRAGMPEDLLQLEMPHINTQMKGAILRLYRSAVDIGPAWGGDLSGLSQRGMIIAADSDPFVPLRVCKTLAQNVAVPVHVNPGGHWAVFDQPGPFAARLRDHWAA